MFLPVFHLVVIVINSYTIWYDQTYVNFPFSENIARHKLPFKNRILFLTMWGLFLQTLYFSIAFLNDVVGTNERSPKKNSIIRIIKDTLFSLAFPIALYVFLAFWIIYFVDRDLIFPDSLAKEMPAWCNHVMHTTIAPFILLELLFSPRNYPKRSIGLPIIVLFSFTYLAYLNYAYTITGSWVYPVLEVLNWPFRIMFFASSILFSMGMYILAETIDSVVNSPTKQVKAKKR